jgi:uncharacterized delta-60 repeat protein
MYTRFYFVWVILLSPILMFAQAGKPDLGFNENFLETGTGADYPVYEMKALPGGELLIGGAFTQYNGVDRRGLAWLNQDGSLNQDFLAGQQGPDHNVLAIAVQPDGKVLIGGVFEHFNGVPVNRIARLHPDGSLDETFDTGEGVTGGNLYDIVLQPDGKILIGGWFTEFNGVSRNGIARLHPDGSLDETFDPGSGVGSESTALVWSLNLLDNGQVLITGNFAEYNGLAANNLARLHPDGAMDETFASLPGTNGWVFPALVQPDGKIMIAGDFTEFQGTARNRIARLHADGSLDASFDPGQGFDDGVYSLGLLSDGKVFASGVFTSFDGSAAGRIVRLNADGSVDPSFNAGAGANERVSKTAILEDGRIIVAGTFTRFDGEERSRIARLEADGALDLTFNPPGGPDATVRALALLSDNKIMIGGEFTAYQGAPASRIARLHADGSLDVSFDPAAGANGNVHDLVVQSDGKVVIAGTFTSYNGVSRNRIARLNPDGSLDGSFNPGSGFNGGVFALALQPDGKILAGGSFSSFNGTARENFVRLNANGSLDNDFGSRRGARGSVHAIALRDDGYIYIGGNFTHYSNQQRRFIARVQPDGRIDNDFKPSSGFEGGGVRALLLQSDGKVIAAGSFSSYEGVPRTRIARINDDASLDMGFDPGMDTSWWPLVLADAGGGKILVGGNVTDAGGNPAERLVRLNANGNLDSGFNVGAGADATILAIAMQPNGDFIIGGDFKSYDNVSRVRIARIFGGSEPDNDPPLPDVDPLPDVLAECSVGFGDLVIPTATDEVDGTIYGKTDESIFPITQQGSHTITWTYTDSSGNSASQDQLIVIHDDVPPVVLTRDITVELDAGGEAVITAAMVDDGTYDNCGIASLELDKTVFTADDLGENIVTLTATDVNGNQASATAVVTVTEVAPKLYVSVAYTGSTFVQAQAHNAQTVDVSLSADLWVSSVNVPGDGRTMTLVFELYDVADPDNSLVEVVGPVEVVHWNISGGSASTQVVVAHTLSISDADARTYEVVAVAGGDYAGSSVRGEIMLTVFKPLRLHVAAGGKTMVYPTYMNGMLYPGEDFSNVAFGAFVRFNNNGNNPRGHAAVSWQQMDRKLVLRPAQWKALQSMSAIRETKWPC